MSSEKNLITDYQQAIDFLYKQLPMFQRVGPKAFKADLDNITQLLQALGNPERKFQSVHIAGTNGKGSVSHILAGALQCAGMKTGLYTSPHYKDFRERIKIDGQFVEKDFVMDFVNKINVLALDLQPSFFEITVAMAFDYFSQQQVDIAVVETGLGGRLDSTNVIDPLLSVITNIGFDHTEFLGNTLPLIAGEKAGIIKAGRPVVIGETQEETTAIFLKKAKDMDAPISFADQVYKIQMLSLDTGSSLAVVKKDGLLLYPGIKVNLLGAYQENNLVTAFHAIDVLSECGVKINQSHLISALENLRQLTGFMGRMQILQTEPTVLVDSAHNREGMQKLMEELSNFSYNSLHILLAVVGDKAPDEVLKLLPTDATYYFSQADIPRAMKVDLLCEKALDFGLLGSVYETVPKAFEAAITSADTGDMVLVCGSIFTVAEVI